MDDLVRWLGEQLDTDTARATAAAEEGGPEWRFDGDAVVTRRERDLVAIGSQDYMEAERGEFIAEHDPAWVLREIEAKRGIVARYEFACHEAAALDIDVEEREKRIASAAAFQSCVLVVAAVYEDRPGYAEAVASVG